MQEGVFVCLFCCLVVLFFLCVLFLLFGKTKGYLRAILEYFFFFVSPKGLSLKSFFSSYSVFFSGFPFVFSFKTPFFLCFLSINPFLENINIFGFFIFLFLAFSFLNVRLFFQTNFPDIPFLKPKLLSFLVVFISSVALVFVFMFMFLPFCFDSGFVLGMFCFVFVLFLFCFLFCFHRLWKTLFSLQVSCFLVMLLTR